MKSQVVISKELSCSNYLTHLCPSCQMQLMFFLYVHAAAQQKGDAEKQKDSATTTNRGCNHQGCGKLIFFWRYQTGHPIQLHTQQYQLSYYVTTTQTRSLFFNFTNHESNFFIRSSVLLMWIQLLHGLAHLYPPNAKFNVHTHSLWIHPSTSSRRMS